MLCIKRLMKSLIRKQELPITLEKAWAFFSSPTNLKLITPSFMGFDIISGNGEEKIYPGMIISYKVKPVLNIPMTWVTEITHVSEMNYFIDNQKSGPYKYWHHQHLFEETDNGTKMTDILNYAAPGGGFGLMAEKLFIAKRVEGIFKYRTEVLKKLLPNL